MEELLSEQEINALIEEVARNGKLTLDLSKIVKEALRNLQPPSEESGGDEPDFDDDEVEYVEVEVSSSTGGETPEIKRKKVKVTKSVDSSDEEAESEEYMGPAYGIQGWGRPPRPQFDQGKISRQRRREIQQNPLEFIEFMYENRRFKLKPIGTIEPVPKRIYFGRSGAPYYYKTRGPHGEKLNIAQWTKVYLKKYQKDQCFSGSSERATGLAGYVDINGECLNRPKPNGRTKASRPSKTKQPQ